nr:helix-hairpin-helix domain-containing protein [Thioalkalivibrio sp. HK1]
MALATLVHAQDTVDINTASAEELAQTITGVGIKKAQAIVEWREQNGPFSSIDELVQVKGIGSKTLDKNRDRLRAGTTSEGDMKADTASDSAN